MGLLGSITQLATMPIRIAGELARDVKSIGDFDDSDGLACLFTCGLSSVGKGIVKTIEKSVEELE